MPIQSYFAANDNNKRDLTGKSLNEKPIISQALDSVRSYQWEIHFELPAQFTQGKNNKNLTLAAKQVRGLGFSVEDIEVNRVNDKVYYPGRPSYEEMEVTFDNLLEYKEGQILFDYMRSTFDPVQGTYGTAFTSDNNEYKMAATVIELNGQMEPTQEIILRGVYPKKYTRGEKNYSTNDFDTIVMTFRYDSMVVEARGS